MALSATVGKLPSVFPVLLLIYPEHLQAITLTQTVISAVLSVLVSPASACIWNHYVKTPDSAKRAEVSQRTSNQVIPLALQLHSERIHVYELTPTWVAAVLRGRIPQPPATVRAAGRADPSLGRWCAPARDGLGRVARLLGPRVRTRDDLPPAKS